VRWLTDIELERYRRQLMAIEAIKLLTGYGKPMLSKMLVFNTIDMEFRKLNIRRERNCEVCGDDMENKKGLKSVIPCDIYTI